MEARLELCPLAEGQKQSSFPLVIFLDEAHHEDWVTGQYAYHVSVLECCSFSSPIQVVVIIHQFSVCSITSSASVIWYDFDTHVGLCITEVIWIHILFSLISYLSVCFPGVVLDRCLLIIYTNKMWSHSVSTHALKRKPTADFYSGPRQSQKAAVLHSWSNLEEATAWAHMGTLQWCAKDILRQRAVMGCLVDVWWARLLSFITELFQKHEASKHFTGVPKQGLQQLQT